jgi:Helix-turn-helix domain
MNNLAPKLDAQMRIPSHVAPCGVVQLAVIQLLRSGWTQAELAKEVGVSQPTIHRICSARRPRRIGYELGAALLALVSDQPVDRVPRSVLRWRRKTAKRLNVPNAAVPLVCGLDSKCVNEV